jgi:hypothetical protein
MKDAVDSRRYIINVSSRFVVKSSYDTRFHNKYMIKGFTTKYFDTLQVRLRHHNATRTREHIQDVIGKDDSLGKFTLDLSLLNLHYTHSEDPPTKWHALAQEGTTESQGNVLLSYELVKREGGQKSRGSIAAKVPCLHCHE